MTAENDRLRMYEVPITFTLTGTVLVLAADPAKALDKTKEQFASEDDINNVFESLIDIYHEPVMKDGDPHSRLEFGRATRSTANPRDYEAQFDEGEFALVDLNEKIEPEFPVSGEPQTAPQPTSRQNPTASVAPAPRPTTAPPPRSAPPPRPQSGPAIGMRGTRDDNPPRAPQSTAPSVADKSPQPPKKP